MNIWSNRVNIYIDRLLKCYRYKFKVLTFCKNQFLIRMIVLAVLGTGFQMQLSAADNHQVNLNQVLSDVHHQEIGMGRWVVVKSFLSSVGSTLGGVAEVVDPKLEGKMLFAKKVASDFLRDLPACGGAVDSYRVLRIEQPQQGETRRSFFTSLESFAGLCGVSLSGVSAGASLVGNLTGLAGLVSCSQVGQICHKWVSGIKNGANGMSQLTGHVTYLLLSPKKEPHAVLERAIAGQKHLAYIGLLLDNVSLVGSCLLDFLDIQNKWVKIVCLTVRDGSGLCSVVPKTAATSVHAGRWVANSWLKIPFPGDALLNGLPDNRFSEWIVSLRNTAVASERIGVVYLNDSSGKPVGLRFVHSDGHRMLEMLFGDLILDDQGYRFEMSSYGERKVAGQRISEASFSGNFQNGLPVAMNLQGLINPIASAFDVAHDDVRDPDDRVVDIVSFYMINQNVQGFVPVLIRGGTFNLDLIMLLPEATVVLQEVLIEN